MTTLLLADLVAERLRLCYLEIPGIVRAFRWPPANPPGPGEWPWAVTLLGAAVEQAGVLAGVFTDTRQYLCRVFGAAGDNGVDEGDLGSSVYRALVPIATAVPRYFVQHNRLQTATLGPLKYLLPPVIVQDRGVDMRIGPGGGSYWTYEAILTIRMRENR